MIGPFFCQDCGERASFGFEVNLSKGKLGFWLCWACKKAREALAAKKKAAQVITPEPPPAPKKGQGSLF